LTQFDQRAYHIVDGSQIFEPDRDVDIRLAKNLPASRLRPEIPQLRVEAIQGFPRRTASLRSSGVELKTVKYAHEGSPMAHRIRCGSRGRSRIF
jgi:hypothetical protein